MASIVAGVGPKTLAGGSAAFDRRVLGSLRRARWQKLVGLPDRSLSVAFHPTRDVGGHACGAVFLRRGSRRHAAAVRLVMIASHSKLKLQVVRHPARMQFGAAGHNPSQPNKAPEPTSRSVTPRAISRESELKPRTDNRITARVAPEQAVAHL